MPTTRFSNCIYNVDNYINPITNQYMHCITYKGKKYVEVTYITLENNNYILAPQYNDKFSEYYNNDNYKSYGYVELSDLQYKLFSKFYINNKFKPFLNQYLLYCEDNENLTKYFF
jgi:hypothetical protein